ncbi:MAG: serine/threonine-protein phosphatase [Clostridia bacterium]|nr:serine/threonine-protein phosphatase [Clostridia bacterium]
MLKFDCCFSTDVGKVRKNNEDNFYLNGNYKRVPEDLTYTKRDLIYRGGVFAVCDGMGGEEHGEKASLFAVETLKEFDEKDINEHIDEYVNTANKKICDLITENNGTRSGTTLALVYIKDGYTNCYNIGDSRIYLIRNKKIQQISEDHTRCMQMIKMGVLTKEQAMSHRDRHVLTQHIGIFPDELIIQAYNAEPIKIQDNDIFLLCSDGLTDMLSDDEIVHILSPNMSAQGYAEELIRAALSKGGKDNITVGIVKNIGKKESFFKRIWRKG